MTNSSTARILFGDSDITESIFAQSSEAVAIVNNRPIVPGHSLIIPRLPFVSILDLPEPVMIGFFSFAGLLTRFLIKEYSATSFDWTVQDGVDAGQTVMHCHLHVMPRKRGDFPNPGDWFQAFQASAAPGLDSDRQPLSSDQLKDVVQRLRGSWQVLSAT
jgi:bis(5'-adenosyl)-triphosphatase